MGLFKKTKDLGSISSNFEPPPQISYIEMPKSDIVIDTTSNQTQSLENSDAPPFYENVQKSQNLDTNKSSFEPTSSQKSLAQETPALQISSQPQPQQHVNQEEVPNKLPKLKSMLEEDLTQEEKIKIALHHKFGLEKPLFIRTIQFSQILQNIDYAKSKLIECEAIRKNIAELKISQDREQESYRELLEDIERKLLFIDRTIFKTELI